MMTLIDTPTIACPNHEGSFDCTPFCRLCEGNQETSLSELLDQAFSIAWDGCHKIYLNMDVQQHNKMIGYGYEYVLIKGLHPVNFEDSIMGWFDDSCSLRFVDALFTNDDHTDKFVSVIPQFFLEEDEEEDD